MGFQFVIDNAESLSIERKQVVASTQTRNGTVRSVSRGGSAWRFEVRLPDGPRWQDYRSSISELELLDRTTTDTIQFNNAGHSWFSQYLGDSVNSTGFLATITQGSTSITLTTSPTTSSGYKFRAGDLIQLGASGHCYTVASDVAYNSNTVTLHRPVIDSSASGVSLRVGPNCVWTVICTQFPSWNIFARDQVSWNGSFVFVEYLL